VCGVERSVFRFVQARRKAPAFPFHFISEKATYNSYIFSEIRTSKSDYDKFTDNGLLKSPQGQVYMHEYGHYLQELYYGKFNYYTNIAISGGTNYLIMLKLGNSEYNYRHTWTEIQANTLSYDYFNRPNYWNFTDFPTDNNFLNLIKHK